MVQEELRHFENGGTAAVTAPAAPREAGAAAPQEVAPGFTVSSANMIQDAPRGPPPPPAPRAPPAPFLRGAAERDGADAREADWYVPSPGTEKSLELEASGQANLGKASPPQEELSS